MDEAREKTAIHEINLTWPKHEGLLSRFYITIYRQEISRCTNPYEMLKQDGEKPLKQWEVRLKHFHLDLERYPLHNIDGQRELIHTSTTPRPFYFSKLPIFQKVSGLGQPFSLSCPAFDRIDHRDVVLMVLLSLKVEIPGPDKVGFIDSSIFLSCDNGLRCTVNSNWVTLITFSFNTVFKPHPLCSVCISVCFMREGVKCWRQFTTSF